METKITIDKHFAIEKLNIIDMENAFEIMYIREVLYILIWQVAILKWTRLLLVE